jgi:hypothetical protein
MADKKRAGNSGAKNLIPVTQRSKDEARQISRNGGIKSGKVRREKKLLKEIVNELLDSEIQTKDGPMNAGAAISMAQLRKALQGDAKAYEVLRDTAGQKPVEKILISDVSTDVMSEIDDLVNAAVPAEPVSQVNQSKTTRKKSTPKDGTE